MGRRWKIDTFLYNGLGMRVGKTDSTGTYSYFCDGASPGSAVLSDGHTVYTPGLSENKGGVSRYYSNDRLGNLWTIDGSSKGQLFYQDTTGFGSVLSQSGTGSLFGFGGGNGCQTDNDIGLVLMGHRYYDARIGRFITQDPAGDGDNWYAYADNDPIDETDPTGLFTPLYHNLAFDSADGTGAMSFGAPSDDWIGGGLELDTRQRTRTGTWVWTPNPTADAPDHGSFNVVWGPWGDWNVISRTPLGGEMFAASPGGVPDSSLTTPGGQAELGQLSEDGVTVGKPGNPFKSIEDAVQKAKEWLGDFGKHVKNKDEDNVFMNKAGTKKLRFDINNPSPHESPHAHMEELINGKWKGIGQIYPRDVPPR